MVYTDCNNLQHPLMNLFHTKLHRADALNKYDTYPYLSKKKLSQEKVQQLQSLKLN